MDKKFPPRLHVLLAREKPYGLVIRRGPSKHTCFVGWDRKRNTFTPAQWMKGRVYEERSDISYDGKYIIYFAMGTIDPETVGTWTAISVAPWMKAICLYREDGTWHGGGLFLSDRTYWLNEGYGNKRVFDSTEVVRKKWYKPEKNFSGDSPCIYHLRLVRDGWTFTGHEQPSTQDGVELFEKPLPGGWVLRKKIHSQANPPQGKKCNWEEHELIDKTKKIQAFADWEWADFDEGRLVWASKGCLFRAQIESELEIGKPKLLYDFNPMEFQAVQAPY